MKRWIVLAIMNRLRKNVTEYVGFPGMRQEQEGQNDWYTLQIVGSTPRRARRGQTDERFIVVIGCHSRVEEIEEGRDIVKPWELADAAIALFEKVDLEFSNLETDTVLGCVNFHDAQTEHLNPRNLVFGGEGDFAIDERLFHTVIVSLTATLVQ